MADVLVGGSGRGISGIGGIVEDKPIVDPKNMARDAKGLWLPGQRPATGIMPGDSERARMLGKMGGERRRQLAAQRARDAITEVVREAGGVSTEHVKGPAGAVGYIAGELVRTSLANMIEKPRDIAPALKLGLRLADMLPEDRQRAAVAAVQVVVTAGGRLDAVEGEWTEG